MSKKIQGASPFGADIAIDLGSANILVYVKGRGVILQEPSIVVVDKHSGAVLSVGAEAQSMLARTPGDLIALRPLHHGTISDYEMTERLLRELLQKAVSSRFFKPRLVLCAPLNMTGVEERALIDAGMQAGAGRVRLVEEPLAAATGAGIDITQPEGHMVVDIGSGTTDIAVVSLSGIVESASFKAAGDQFDEAVVKYIRRKHNALIGMRSAEALKCSIGCVCSCQQGQTVDVKGRCLETGLPKVFAISSTEMAEAFATVTAQLLEQLHEVLERTPPELLSDISQSGIFLTGGGSLIRGMDELITSHTGIKAHLVEDPVTAVARGAGALLEGSAAAQPENRSLSHRWQLYH